MQRTEAADWTGMRAEDARAEFEAFFRLHRDLILRIALAITGDREAASDAAQDAFVRVLDRWKRVREMDAPEAFLKRVAVRSAIDSLRARRDGPPQEARALKTDSEDVAVRQVLGKLKPDQQALLALSIGEGWSYAEIAEALRVPQGTVASRIHAAKEAFRREWGEE